MTLARRLKRTASRELREAKSWQARHAVAAAHGLRFLPRGGGLVLEDIASGEITTASSVSNQLSLGRAEKHLGPYEPPTEPLPPVLQLREEVVRRARQQAELEHARRRRAITASVQPGAERQRWFAASRSAFADDQRDLQGLHALGSRLQHIPPAQWTRERESKPALVAVFRAHAQAMLGRRPERGPARELADYLGSPDPEITTRAHRRTLTHLGQLRDQRMQMAKRSLVRPQHRVPEATLGAGPSVAKRPANELER